MLGLFCWVGLDWAGLGWVGLCWVGLGWVGFCWDGLGWAGFFWDGLGWAGFCWDGLGFAGFCWDGLGFAGFCWIGLLVFIVTIRFYSAILWLPDLMVEKIQTVIHFLYWTDWWISRQLVRAKIDYWGVNLCQCCKTSDHMSMYYLNESDSHANFCLSPA